VLSKLYQYLTILRWLYSLNLTIDANFRLKNKAHAGGIENDPPLGDGWGHWVPNEPYQQYLAKYSGGVEVCKYVSLAAHCGVDDFLTH
jgi:hypothetical protein